MTDHGSLEGIDTEYRQFDLDAIRGRSIWGVTPTRPRLLPLPCLDAPSGGDRKWIGRGM